MILELEIKKDNNGNVDLTRSDYRPTKEEQDMILKVLQDYQLAYEIQSKPYREFNDRTLKQYQADSQRAFNSYVPPKSADPDKRWHANVVRPITRNKVISIAAHVASTVLFPQIFAQNENDEEDRSAAIVMRDLHEWSADQSDYAKTFVYAVVAACVNPAVILHTEYAEKMHTVKEMNDDGTWVEREQVDEVYSGFQDRLVAVDELFIGDMYEANIQKQPFLIWRRNIPFTTAKAKYGNRDNFQYVKPGLQAIFHEGDEWFYEQYDDELEDRLVEEIIYYNRTLDLQLVIVNGVLLTPADQPLKRRDKRYPFAKSGFELIDEGYFFYYKSLVDKLKDDQKVVDKLYNMVIDGTYLQVMPAIGVFGSTDIGANVMVPGMVTGFGDSDVKMQVLSGQGSLNAGLNMLEKAESSMSESSADSRTAGISGRGEKTAFEVAQLEQNAQVMLGLFGKMVSFLVKDFGELRTGDILQHLTVGDVAEVTGEGARLKFRNFLVPNRNVRGENKTRRIEFDMEAGEGGMEESFDILQRETKMDVSIMRVNPDLFRRMKYLIKVQPDFRLPVSDSMKKALALEAYDRAIGNPAADQEAIYRDFLLGQYEFSKDNPDKYVKQQQAMTPGTEQPRLGSQPRNNLVSQLTGAGDLSVADLAGNGM